MAKFTGHTITDDSALGGIEIEKSLRFEESDNTYLSASPTFNTKKYTFSVWVKPVKKGGGFNHRFNLSDEFLIKDNHLIAEKNLRKLIKKANKSKMIDLTAMSMKLEVDGEIIEIPFDHKLVDSADAHKTLVAMLKDTP